MDDVYGTPCRKRAGGVCSGVGDTCGGGLHPGGRWSVADADGESGDRGGKDRVDRLTAFGQGGPLRVFAITSRYRSILSIPVLLADFSTPSIFDGASSTCRWWWWWWWWWRGWRGWWRGWRGWWSPGDADSSRGCSSCDSSARRGRRRAKR